MRGINMESKHNKHDSLVLHTSYYYKLHSLTFEQKGKLLDAIFCYQLEIEQPQLDERTQMALDMICVDIKTNNEKYARTCRQRAKAGMKGANVRWNKDKASDDKNSNCHNDMTSKANITDNENGKGKDIGYDNENNREKKQSTFSLSLPLTHTSVKNYCNNNKLDRLTEESIENFVSQYADMDLQPGELEKKLKSWNFHEKGKKVTANKGDTNINHHNKFNNFSQRNYDFDDLEKKLRSH